MDINPNVVLWLVVGLIAIAAIVFRFLEQASRHHMLRTLAENGQPIPPEIFISKAEAYHRTAASFHRYCGLSDSFETRHSSVFVRS